MRHRQPIGGRGRCTLRAMEYEPAGNRTERLSLRILGWRPSSYPQIWVPVLGLVILGLMSYHYKMVHMRHPGPWYGVLAFVAAGVFASLGLRQRRQLAAMAERLRETPSVIPREVIDLLCQSKRLQAIKRYRELTEGVDLRQAKYVIDNVGRP
jgi:hypothetical protein